jgi:hypothetical protein
MAGSPIGAFALTAASLPPKGETTYSVGPRYRVPSPVYFHDGSGDDFEEYDDPYHGDPTHPYYFHDNNDWRVMT